MSLPNPDDILIGGVNCIAAFAFKTPSPRKEVYSSLPKTIVSE
jgi:hypothetical protein